METVTLIYTWRFERVLPALPGPNTKAFVPLFTALADFGLTPDDVTVDEPSRRLSDVAIRFSLGPNLAIVCFFDRLELRYAGGELPKDWQRLADLINKSIAALRHLDDKAANGLPEVSVKGHAPVEDPDGGLAAQLQPSLPEAGVTADVLVLRVPVGGEPARVARVLLTKSVVLPSGWYMEISVAYDTPDSPLATFGKFLEDQVSAIGTLMRAFDNRR